MSNSTFFSGVESHKKRNTEQPLLTKTLNKERSACLVPHKSSSFYESRGDLGRTGQNLG